MSLKLRVLKDTALYSAANYVAMAIGIGLSVASKAVLGPVGAGYWAIVKVFLTYSGFVDLGSKDAAFRDIAQAAGAGDETRRTQVRDSVFFFVLGTSVLAAAVVAVIAAFSVGDAKLRAALYVASALIIVTQLYNLMLTMLRAEKKIGILSAVVVLNMALMSVFAIGGAMAWGVTGFVAGALVAGALVTAWGWRQSGARIAGNVRAARVGALVKVGFPLAVAGYAFDTFLSIDAIMIARWLGVEALGWYTIALMSVQQINSLGRFAQIVLMPHIQESFGRTGRIAELKTVFVRFTNALIHVLPLVIGAVYFAVPAMVALFLPKFLPGLGAMKVLVIAYYFVAANEMAATILFTTDRQMQLVPLFFAMTGVGALINWVFIRAGWGINGVAVATAIAYFVYFAVLFVAGFRHILEKAEMMRMMLKIVSIAAYFATALVLTDRLIATGSVLLDCPVKFLVYVVALLPLLVRLEKKERLWGMLVDRFRAGRIAPTAEGVTEI